MSDAPPLPPEDEDVAALRACALGYPEAWEDFPWGHTAIKVKKKIFLSLYVGEEALSLSVKLPLSHPAALQLPYTEPTGYGLGKSGWVTARFGPADEVPLELVRQWIDESYRAVAPKALIKRLPTP